MKFYSILFIALYACTNSFTQVAINIDGSAIVAPKTLRNYKEILLTQGFNRTPKSHFVNRLLIIYYMSDGILTIVDKSIVETTRRRQHEVIELLKKRND